MSPLPSTDPPCINPLLPFARSVGLCVGAAVGVGSATPCTCAEPSVRSSGAVMLCSSPIFATNTVLNLRRSVS
jgi:hypothetical protein